MSNLFEQLARLRSAPQFLMSLANDGSDRLTLSQAAFFMLAATADANGQHQTRTELLSNAGFRPSLRNSYRQLLETSRVYPNALGWLKTSPNPNDEREQFLVLTKEGRAVIDRALSTLTLGSRA